MSRSNTRSRRSQWKAAPVQLVPCSNRACKQPKPQHIACPTCGQYDGRQVVEPA
jgi:large subunit ribosomal protein L32